MSRTVQPDAEQRSERDGRVVPLDRRRANDTPEALLIAQRASGVRMQVNQCIGDGGAHRLGRCK